jgi:hypothetical protein
MVEGDVWSLYLEFGSWKANGNNKGWDGLSHMDVMGICVGVCFHPWLVYLRVHFLQYLHAL